MATNLPDMSRLKGLELQLDGTLMADAKELGLDAAAVMEDALRTSVKAERERRWQRTADYYSDSAAETPRADRSWR